MSTTLQIAEVAQRSGFTPATLRYYEQIGLLTPPTRSKAGYRLYDDTSLERLRFIARAKRLGCSLDEIAELASVRDGGQCATVQERLRGTVATKIDEAHTQIAAMTTLVAELQHVAATLSTDPVDGPCDDRCACAADDPPSASPPTSSPLWASMSTPTASPSPSTSPATSSESSATTATTTSTATITSTATTTSTATDGETRVPTSVTLVEAPDALPAVDAGAVPIACTLGAGEMASRLDEWAALLADRGDLLQGVTARIALDDGLRLEFGPNTDVAEIARLAAAEQGCCRFFDFALVIDGRGIALEVRAPADAQPVLAALFGAPA